MGNIEILSGDSVLLDRNPSRLFLEFKWEPAPRRRSLIERLLFIKGVNQDLSIDCDFEVSTEARDVNHNLLGETSFKRNGSIIEGVKHFTGKRHQEFVCIDFDKMSSKTECLLFSIFDERPAIFWRDGHFTCTITNGDKVELLKYKYRFPSEKAVLFPHQTNFFPIPCVVRIKLIDNEWVFTALADI
ncbi:hypothetical protein ACTG16_23255 [Aeromonas sp. 23P]|uniref:hypothetical protein n=1 Tax=Aeromonas sp. 23P TaxID=3452716 RepID=UPI003F790C6F|nr:hypothetical protein [Aeromonas veronii]